MLQIHLWGRCVQCLLLYQSGFLRAWRLENPRINGWRHRTTTPGSPVSEHAPLPMVHGKRLLLMTRYHTDAPKSPRPACIRIRRRGHRRNDEECQLMTIWSPWAVASYGPRSTNINQWVALEVIPGARPPKFRESVVVHTLVCPLTCPSTNTPGTAAGRLQSEAWSC